MRKLLYIALACLLLAGCAQGTRSKLAEDSKLIRENEHRLASLENSVTALNSQIAQLNNRVYEVRTKSGQKTSMTVVPVNKPVAAATPAQTENTGEPPTPLVVQAPQETPKQPQGKKIDPAVKPGPLPAKAATQPPVKTAQAKGSIGRPEPAAGPAEQPAPETGDLALPPAELPPGEVPVPQGNVSPQLPPMEETPPIPVPVLPATDLSLPSEQPVQAPARTPAPKPVAKNAAQGEQAAYNTALNAARSGKTAEGIRLFREFLQKYPNGPYAANAEYWIGECLYSQGKYKDALSEFQTVNNSYPSHHKNADALLKAGITMSKMGDKEGAAEKFRTLIANFPNSDAARRARAMGAH